MSYANGFVTPFSPNGYCGIVVACICPSVRPSVREICLVRTITRHRFELESPNLHQTCILWYSGLVLKIGVIDLDLQVFFGHFDLQFWAIRFVRAINRHRFGQESPNLNAGNVHHGMLSASIDQLSIDQFGHFDSGFYEIWLIRAISFLVLNTGSLTLGHFESGFQGTAFHVALVYWFRQANGVLQTQTGSCCALFCCGYAYAMNFFIVSYDRTPHIFQGCFTDSRVTFIVKDIDNIDRCKTTIHEARTVYIIHGMYSVSLFYHSRGKLPVKLFWCHAKGTGRGSLVWYWTRILDSRFRWNTSGMRKGKKGQECWWAILH